MQQKGSITRLGNGFGYIQTKNGTEHLFHVSELVGEDFSQLRVDDVVTFEVDEKSADAKRIQRM